MNDIPKNNISLSEKTRIVSLFLSDIFRHEDVVFRIIVHIIFDYTGSAMRIYHKNFSKKSLNRGW